MHQKITINPLVRFGKPCIKGTRVAVSDILSLIAGGYSLGDIPGQYPGISKDDVIAAIEYASQSMEHPTEIISPS
ncbi:MAG: DUF433 domain-containing protein [Deltaproteobacteria bacterium]